MKLDIETMGKALCPERTVCYSDGACHSHIVDTLRETYRQGLLEALALADGSDGACLGDEAIAAEIRDRLEQARR